MARWEDRDSRFRRLEVKTGLLVLAALTGVVLLIVFLGVERGYFTKKFSIHFVTDSISGLSRGMPVKLSGFKIGRVKGFEFIEGAKVRVTIVINRKHQVWLRTGSKARRSKVGYIGESYIEIMVGEAGGRMLDDGDLIPYELTGGMEDIIKEALPVLNEVKEIIHYINDLILIFFQDSHQPPDVYLSNSSNYNLSTLYDIRCLYSIYLGFPANHCSPYRSSRSDKMTWGYQQ